MLKPYPFFTFTTQCPLSISDHPIPFPFNPFPKINSSFFRPNFLSLTHHPIVSARKINNARGWFSQPSNRKMLELASMIALNLKILPEPFNSLVGEIARGNWSVARPAYPILNHLGGKGRGKGKVFGVWGGRKTKKTTKFVWFVFAFALICVAGLWSWRISELDLFVRALLFCFVGVSLIRLCWGKKGIKEGFLGFFFGVVLAMSSRLGKEDFKFWVEKLRVFSPVKQIVVRNRNRNRNWRMSK